MKLFRVICFIIIGIHGLWAPAFGAEMPIKKSIGVMKPGIGIGDIKLGTTIKDFIKIVNIAPSDKKTIREKDKAVEYWLGYTNIGVTFVFNADYKLDRILVTNPGIIIPKKEIRVNSSSADLKKVYGEGITKRIDEKHEQWGYNGISFVINKDTNKIETIIIRKQ